MACFNQGASDKFTVELALLNDILKTKVIRRLGNLRVIVKGLRNAFQTPLIHERREVFEYLKLNLEW